MAEWTPEAREYLEGYLAQVSALARQKGDDADEIAADLRVHITCEAEKAVDAVVTLDDLRRTIAVVGTPEQVIDAGLPTAIPGTPRPSVAREDAPTPLLSPMPPAPRARSSVGCWIVGIVAAVLCAIAIPAIVIAGLLLVRAGKRAESMYMYHVESAVRFDRGVYTANEKAVIDSLRTIASAQTQYHAYTRSYATTIGALYAPDDLQMQFIDAELAIGTKQGYVFSITSTDPAARWKCEAKPSVQSKDGARAFTTDETGVIFCDGRPI
ncbi:MAG TPA: hypothetical protein HPP83_06000 [Candidatus Hydrogenedentes bacterium]|nr:hypothetical protein [Candidatus Hydrogenedentota bacterium]